MLKLFENFFFKKKLIIKSEKIKRLKTRNLKKVQRIKCEKHKKSPTTTFIFIKKKLYVDDRIEKFRMTCVDRGTIKRIIIASGGLEEL